MQIADVTGRRYDIGKALIFAYTEDDGVSFKTWDGSGNFFENLRQKAGTESPVSESPNSEYSDLVIEDTGPAIHKRYMTGESPTLTLNVYATDEAITFFSPTGTASAGFTRRPLVKEYSLWVVPEQLFATYNPNGKPDFTADITFTGGVFLKDGDPLTVDEQELADVSRIYWRVHSERLVPPFDSADGGNARAEVTLQVMQDFTKPDGCQLYLSLSEMDDYEYELDFEGAGS
jgi:hypothetical protein